MYVITSYSIHYTKLYDDDHDAEAIARRRRARPRIGGLIDDPRLAAQCRRKQALRVVLQHDEPGREHERLSRLARCGQIAVQVGAREHDDQRALRMRTRKSHDRRVASARMQREQLV